MTGLEALKMITERHNYLSEQYNVSINGSKSSLKCNKRVFKALLNPVLKELKALEIIKEKRVDVFYFKSCKTLEEYNYEVCEDIYGFCKDGIKRKILTQEEYDLLKEIL